MAANEIIAQLGGWDSNEVSESCEEWRGDRRWCVIRLRPRMGLVRCCSGCVRLTAAVHVVRNPDPVMYAQCAEYSLSMDGARLPWLVQPCRPCGGVERRVIGSVRDRTLHHRGVHDRRTKSNGPSRTVRLRMWVTGSGCSARSAR